MKINNLPQLEVKLILSLLTKWKYFIASRFYQKKNVHDVKIYYDFTIKLVLTSAHFG